MFYDESGTTLLAKCRLSGDILDCSNISYYATKYERVN